MTDDHEADSWHPSFLEMGQGVPGNVIVLMESNPHDAIAELEGWRLSERETIIRSQCAFGINGYRELLSERDSSGPAGGSI